MLSHPAIHLIDPAGGLFVGVGNIILELIIAADFFWTGAWIGKSEPTILTLCYLKLLSAYTVIPDFQKRTPMSAAA
jgi:hypothetical protein